MLDRRPDAAERLLEIAEEHNRAGQAAEVQAALGLLDARPPAGAGVLPRCDAPGAGAAADRGVAVERERVDEHPVRRDRVPTQREGHVHREPRRVAEGVVDAVGLRGHPRSVRQRWPRAAAIDDEYVWGWHLRRG